MQRDETMGFLGDDWDVLGRFEFAVLDHGYRIAQRVVCWGFWGSSYSLQMGESENKIIGTVSFLELRKQGRLFEVQAWLNSSRGIDHTVDLGSRKDPLVISR